MVMRYLWGLGVGHTYTHRKTKSPLGDDGIDHAGEDDQLIDIQNEAACDSDSCDDDDDDDETFERESDVDSEILEIYGWFT
jgi:hypothetical protein